MIAKLVSLWWLTLHCPYSVTTLIQANQVKELETMIHKDNTKYKLKAFALPVEGKIN